MPFGPPGKGKISNPISSEQRERKCHILPAQNPVHSQILRCTDRLADTIRGGADHLHIRNGTGVSDSAGQPPQSIRFGPDILEPYMAEAEVVDGVKYLETI